MEKPVVIQTSDECAGFGEAATDRYGHALVTFDPKVEAKLRRKIDLHIVPIVALLYLFCFIDRANIGNAKLAGLEKDLKLEKYDYNVVLSIFFVSYIIFEVPATILCKWMGPGWFLPATSLGFGICSVACAFVNNKAQISGVRFLLGLFEAGLMPSIAYYLSRWYRRSELALRLSGYIVTAPLAGAFGGLLASGILSLDHFGTLHKWRMIFGIEGVITIGLSLIAFCILTDRPETARWLTAAEREIALARIKSERVGATAVLDRMDAAKLVRGVLNPVTLGTGLVFLLNNVTVQGLAFFAPTIVRTIYPHQSVVRQQLHTVPPYVVGAATLVLLSYLSTRTDRRCVFFIASAPLTILGYVLFLASDASRVRYGASFLVAAGAFSYGALCNAQVSANVVSDTARASAVGVNVMMGNVGGLISTWSFLPFDAPDYHIGNGLNLATSSTILVVSIGLLIWMNFDNKRREKRDVDTELAGLEQKEIEHLDWRHPAFRWRP